MVCLLLDPVALLPWAKSIARGVRADYQFRPGSTEEQELESVAYLALVELTIRYDEARLPATGDLYGQFRGWAAREVRCRIRREAARLRSGGLFWTTADPAARKLRVEALPTTRDDNSVEVALAAPEPEPEPDDDPEDVTCRFEPRLVIVNSGGPARDGRDNTTRAVRRGRRRTAVPAAPPAAGPALASGG